MVKVVDVDLLFLATAAADFALLAAAAVWAGERLRPGRLCLGAALGGLLDVWAQFPGPGRLLATLPGKVAALLALLAAAFAPLPLYRAGRLVAAALLAGFAMGGGALAMGALDDGSLYLAAAGIGCALAGGRLVWLQAVERRRLAPHLVPVTVHLAGASASLTALVDTGCQIRDPAGGRPVLVAEALAFPHLAHLAGSPAAAVEQLPPGSACLLPYTSLGCRQGLLLGLRGAEVRGMGGERLDVGVVALAPAPIHPAGAYQALLSPEAFPEPGRELA